MVTFFSVLPAAPQGSFSLRLPCFFHPMPSTRAPLLHNTLTVRTRQTNSLFQPFLQHALHLGLVRFFLLFTVSQTRAGGKQSVRPRGNNTLDVKGHSPGNTPPSRIQKMYLMQLIIEDVRAHACQDDRCMLRQQCRALRELQDWRADLEWRHTGARPSLCLRTGPSSVTALIPIREL